METYVKGREIQVGILDGKALPPIEIIPNEGFYDYENKYQPGGASSLFSLFVQGRIYDTLAKSGVIQPCRSRLLRHQAGWGHSRQGGSR